MPHKNWRFGSLSASTPLRHDPDSPSSPCSPLHPIRPRPTASSRLAPRNLVAKVGVGPLQLSFSVYSPLGQTATASTSSTTTASTQSPNSSSNSNSSAKQSTSPTSSSENTDTSTESTDNIPDSPQYWQWKCHLCSRRYNLGTTRRCLEDGHYFCSRPVDPLSSPPPTSASPPPLVFASSVEELLYEKAKRKREKKRKRACQRACKSEFDYGGWERWNSWKSDENKGFGSEDECDYEIANECKDTREHGKNIHETGGEKRDCWNNCAYPSECLRRIQLAAEARKEVEQERFAAKEEKEWNAMVYGSDFHPEDQQELVSTEWDGSPYIVGHTTEEEILGMQVYAPFEHEYENGNQGMMKIEYTNNPPEDLYIETEHLEFEEEPVEIDPDDGLSIETESIFLHLCAIRRHSVVGAAGGSSKIPSSPLKTSFGFEEVEMGDEKMGGVEVGDDLGLDLDSNLDLDVDLDIAIDGNGDAEDEEERGGMWKL